MTKKKMFFGLKNIPTARLMFSVRKIVPSYSGYCMRVKRSSDNTEQDFGFVSGLLDTASILTFVGGGNGIVKTWYNQSIVAHATDASNNNSCFIVQSGTLVTDLNGLPAIINTSAYNLGLTVSSGTPFLRTDIPNYLETIYKVENCTTNNEAGLRASSSNYYCLMEGSFTRFQSRRNATNYIPTGFPGRNILLLLSSVRTADATSNNFRAYGNGTTFALGDITGVWLDISINTYITGGAGGKIQEVRWYQEAQSDTTRNAMTTEINSYYSVY